MRNIYAALLRLYPMEFQQVFAAEMIDTFEQAARDWRGRGRLALWCFAGWEMAGLLRGLATEWMEKSSARDEYVRSCARLQERCSHPTKAARIERRIERAIRGMEFAIANHDFPRARFYAKAEGLLREQLQRLSSLG